MRGDLLLIEVGKSGFRLVSGTYLYNIRNLKMSYSVLKFLKEPRLPLYVCGKKIKMFSTVLRISNPSFSELRRSWELIFLQNVDFYPCFTALLWVLRNLTWISQFWYFGRCAHFGYSGNFYYNTRRSSFNYCKNAKSLKC